jgi:hypothetical protein
MEWLRKLRRILVKKSDSVPRFEPAASLIKFRKIFAFVNLFLWESQIPRYWIKINHVKALYKDKSFCCSSCSSSSLASRLFQFSLSLPHNYCSHLRGKFPWVLEHLFNFLWSRLNSGNACYHSVQNLLSSRLLSKNIKIRIYKTIILPVILYGCENWSLTLRDNFSVGVYFSDQRMPFEHAGH